MLNITIRGMPPDAENLPELIDEIRKEIPSLSLEIPEDEIVVWLPADLVIGGLGEELIVVIEGFEGFIGVSPRTSRSALESIAEKILHALEAYVCNYLKRCIKIEIFAANLQELSSRQTITSSHG